MLQYWEQWNYYNQVNKTTSWYNSVIEIIKNISVNPKFELSLIQTVKMTALLGHFVKVYVLLE